MLESFLNISLKNNVVESTRKVLHIVGFGSICLIWDNLIMCYTIPFMKINLMVWSLPIMMDPMEVMFMPKGPLLKFFLLGAIDQLFTRILEEYISRCDEGQQMACLLKFMRCHTKTMVRGTIWEMGMGICWNNRPSF